MEPWTFEPPTEHYDEKLATIDDKICQLMKQRKVLSNDNPSFPTRKYITDWSEKYGFNEEFLNTVFSDLLNENLYKPKVEPKNFLKNIPILKAFEKEDIFYFVTLIRQFENASVVELNISDKIIGDTSEWNHPEEHLELSIKAKGKEFDCINDGGGGIPGSMTNTFIVSPALPDDVSEYELIFQAYKTIFAKDAIFEFTI
ncbi:hypothetical protein [Marinilactibacillus sp. Marseille-P9653]|uniref:hypothetical protein n=1 Tax=Marinilactibacillus sp. Marseille-P9653 TaxID=2866583 RepID=UPI001CE475CB|nr:hypothetical protein [Marinilactibacillus sp. Marseille-P9653]